MSFISIYWPYIESFLKIAPGIAIFPLTIVLAWKKFRHKVHISYSMSHNRISAASISEIVLTNLKDKPLIVHAIHLMVDKHLVIPIQEFKPPLVIKGLEAAVIEPDKVSAFYFGGEEYELNKARGQIYEFYLSTTGEIIKCEIVNPPTIEAFYKFKDYDVAQRHTNQYNGIVYNDNAIYALIYKYEGKSCTAIVERGGAILTGWPFLPNALRPADLVSAATVKAALMGSEIKHIIKESELYVHRLD